MIISGIFMENYILGGILDRLIKAKQRKRIMKKTKQYVEFSVDYHNI